MNYSVSVSGNNSLIRFLISSNSPHRWHCYSLFQGLVWCTWLPCWNNPAGNRGLEAFHTSNLVFHTIASLTRFVLHLETPLLSLLDFHVWEVAARGYRLSQFHWGLWCIQPPKMKSYIVRWFKKNSFLTRGLHAGVGVGCGVGVGS